MLSMNFDYLLPSKGMVTNHLAQKVNEESGFKCKQPDLEA
jgi:hypothetical protein